MRYGTEVPFEQLLGKTLTKIDEDDGDFLTFHTSDGVLYQMGHHQDCCESVYLEDTVGDLSDLLNSPIIQAECVVNPEDGSTESKTKYDSETWTFYKLATIKGSVTLRWYGSSNGYYSESVDFERIES